MTDERPSLPPDPLAASLERRIALARAEHARATAHLDRLGNVRLAMATACLVLLVLPLFVRHGGPWWALGGVLAGFLVLGRKLERAIDRAEDLRAAILYLEGELARVEERWRSLPDQGADLVPLEPGPAARAADLDLFGPASLYQLVSRTATRRGRATLAGWLLHGAGPEVAVARQAAVAELAGQEELREALVVALTARAHGALDDARLVAWAKERGPFPRAGLLRGLAFVLPLFTVGAAVAAAFGAPGGILAVAVLLHGGTLFLLRHDLRVRIDRLSGSDRGFLRFARVIERIERASFSAPRLVELKGWLGSSSGASAGVEIGRLLRLVDLLDARLNAIFALSIGPLVMFDLHVVLAAERWLDRVAPHLERWFQAIGELEALASLGGFAATRPDYAFPSFAAGEAVYRAEALAHPLIDRRGVVANDLELGGRGSVLLLSGSNMSGKSTFLRSVGLSVVMAEAGAPVAAKRLELSAFELVTSVRVVDSLARGASHFYAELERIKVALDLAKEHGARVLYLLDELLHGTNSRERYIGAVSVIRSMSEAGAVGIVTTHDLEVARVGEVLPPGRVENRHFGDEVEQAKIEFDYRLKPGPVSTTNALRLMKAIGIDIRLEAPDPPRS